MKRIGVSLIALGLLTTFFVGQASALTVKAKPTKPVITQVTSRKAPLKGRVNVTVAFQIAKTHKRSPLTATEVQIGKSVCTVTGKATKCTAKNLVSGKKVRVSVRSKNRNGFGSWSSSVSFLTKPGVKWVRKNPGSPTTSTRPAQSTMPSTSSSTIPNSNAVSFNLTEANALAVLSSSVVSAGVRKTSASSNIRGIRRDGSVFEALESGTLDVRNVFVAPNDNIYMLLRSVAQVDGGPCILLQVRKDDGSARCVEREPSSIQTDLRYNNRIEQYIQFDESGAIYYSVTPSAGLIGSKGYFEGWKTLCRTQHGNTAESLIVRRWKDGVVTDFGYGAEPGKATNQPEQLMFPEPGYQHSSGQSVTGLQYVTDRCVGKFAVSTTGEVMLDQSMGHFTFPWNFGPSSIGYLTMHYDSNGVKRDVTHDGVRCPRAADGFRCNELSLLQTRGPDTAYVNCLPSYTTGPLIMGLCVTNTRTGETGAMKAGEWWLPEVCEVSGSGPRRTAYMCNWGGTHWSQFWKSPTGRSYALVGGTTFCVVAIDKCSADESNWEEINRTGIVVEVEPRFRATSLGGQPAGNILDNVEALVPVMGSVIASGPVAIEDDGSRPINFKTVLYDLETGTARDLIAIERGLRVRKLWFSATLSKAYFVATQTSDDRRVVGTVDIVSGKISMFDSELMNLEDLQVL
jgi:hypothetical protein